MGCDKRYGWQYGVGAHLFNVLREDANEADLAVILEKLGLFLSHHQQVGHLCWDHNIHMNRGVLLQIHNTKKKNLRSYQCVI